jgi:hypothetical protein
MSSPVETAARRYIDACTNPDPKERARLLEAAFAENGRFVSPSAALRGRTAVLEAIERFANDPRGLRARIVSAVHCQALTFRFRSVIETPDGAYVDEFLDTGEVDSEGRIVTLFSFRGPLADAG